MSEYLPARRNGTALTATQSAHPSNGGYRLRDWFYSPVGRAVADVLPDLLRWASRRQPSESRPLTSHVLPATDGANGMTISEVELDIDAPFIRRVVIRSASSWSVAPGVLMAEQKRRRGRVGLSALTVGLLGIAGVVFARRSGVSLPSGVTVPESLPRVLSAFRKKEYPAEAE
jgi:hypothetical protein